MGFSFLKRGRSDVAKTAAPAAVVAGVEDAANDLKTRSGSGTPQTKPKADPETQRIKALVDLCASDQARATGMDTHLKDWVDKGVTVEKARAMITDAKADMGDDGGEIMNGTSEGFQASTNRVGHSWDRGSGLVDKMADGLLARVDAGHEPTIGREFAHASLSDLAKASLAAQSHTRMSVGSRASEVQAALTTSDLPAVLGSVMRRQMNQAYEAANSGLKQTSKEDIAPDFREIHAVQMSVNAELEEVREGGEYKHGAIDDGKESYRLITHGKIISVHRQAVVNDDLGAFTERAPLLGRAAAEKEAKLFAEILTDNSGLGPTMDDGKTHFHADHGNLSASGAPPSVTTLNAARTAMRRQKGLAGEAVNVVPEFLVVPPELETAAEQLIAQITAADTSNVNPFAGKLRVIVDPFLESAKRWYLAAKPGYPDGLHHAYLEGEKGPQFFQREGFEIDGVEFKVRLDFGAGFVDHRAWYMNPGE